MENEDKRATFSILFLKIVDFGPLRVFFKLGARWASKKSLRRGGRGQTFSAK